MTPTVSHHPEGGHGPVTFHCGVCGMTIVDHTGAAEFKCPACDGANGRFVFACILWVLFVIFTAPLLLSLCNLWGLR